MVESRANSQCNPNAKKPSAYGGLLFVGLSLGSREAFAANYFGGAGVKISRLAGSGFGLGFGAFLVSFLPLSLLPMIESMTQNAAPRKAKITAEHPDRQ